jgi:hypothetical protein
MSEQQVYIMEYGIRKSRGQRINQKVKVRKTLVIAALCLCLFVFGPHYQTTDSLSLSPKPVQAQTAGGDTQGSTSSDAADDDTPSDDEIADFASEYDQDGDGEVDEPEDEDDAADEDEPDDADQEDEGDDGYDGDESDDQDRENEYDDDDDGEETLDEEEEDIAHSGKNRDDIDGEASPEFRLSSYDRYRMEGNLRRLGTREELTPLIGREERMLLENY